MLAGVFVFGVPKTYYDTDDVGILGFRLPFACCNVDFFLIDQLLQLLIFGRFRPAGGLGGIRHDEHAIMVEQ